MARRWKGVLVVEDQQTGDGRIIAPGAVVWADPPLPLGLLENQQHGDGMANPGGPVIGTIDTITRQGNQIIGEGDIDDGSELGAEICRKMDAGLAPLGTEWGISIDPDDWAFEVVDTTTELVEAAAEDAGEDYAGRVVAKFRGRSTGAPLFAVTAAAGDALPTDGVVVYEEAVDGTLQRFTRLRMRGATLCAIAAFDACRVALVASDTVPGQAPAAPVTAAAVFGGVPAFPPKRWFSIEPPLDDTDPRLVEQVDAWSGEFIGLACPLTIVTDGPDRGLVYGHLAPENRCHVGIPGACVTAGDLASDYSHFLLGSTPTAEGDRVITGPLLVGCDHADKTLSAKQARDHYANTGMAWADVTLRNTPHGPWFCGALRPDVTDELVRVLCSSGQVSGDWRGDTGRHELMAAQVVSTPGFTVQRVRPIAASARVVDIAPWRPRIEIDGDRMLWSTQPVTAARAASGCECGGTCGGCASERPAAVVAGLGSIYAEVVALRADIAAIRRQTALANADRIARARERLAEHLVDA